MDYSKTHFYKIVCKDVENSNMYIGHTTSFTKRKNTHKNNCCNPDKESYNTYVYKYIRENGDWENWDMILIDTLPCENRLDALKQERTFIEELKPSLNQIRPYRTDEDEEIQRLEQNERKRQDRQNNPDKYKEIDRLKYERRRDEALTKSKEHYHNNKEQIHAKRKDTYYNKGGKEKNSERCKSYRANNPDKVKEAQRNWLEKNNVEVICECGLQLLKRNLPIHVKRKKHQQYLQSLE